MHTGCRARYGLLEDEEDIPSRQYVAVPFVGQDTPSERSEFSSPEAVGLITTRTRYAISRADRPVLMLAKKEHFRYLGVPTEVWKDNRALSLTLWASR